MDFLKKFDSFILFSQKRFLNCTLEINVVFFSIYGLSIANLSELIWTLSW